MHVFPSLHILIHTCIFCLFYNSPSSRHAVIYHCGFDLLSLMITDAEHFSCTCWPFKYLLWENICLGHFLVSKLDYLFFVLFFTIELYCCVLYLVTQLCPTLCDPMDCSPPGSFVHGDSPGKNTGVGCHALLQGIFPTQGLNPGLLHCGQLLYHLSHKGSPRILEWVIYPFSRGSSQPRNWTWGLLHCRQILCQLSYQGSPLNYINILYILDINLLSGM